MRAKGEQSHFNMLGRNKITQMRKESYEIWTILSKVKVTDNSPSSKLKDPF